jgi:hypothetical protein
MFKWEDSKGVGGFTESLLAIMVVTVSVVLFTVTISIDLADLGERDVSTSIEEACEFLLEEFLQNYSSLDGKTLSETSLTHVTKLPLSLPTSAIGYRLVVNDLVSQGPELVNIQMGSGPVADRPISHIRLPINIVLNDGRTVAGLVEVSCW